MNGAELLVLTPEPDWEDAGTAALARLLAARGLSVTVRRLVPEEAEVERALRQALEGRALVVVLEEAAGALARRLLARLLGSRLVLSERLLEALAADFQARGQAMPREAEQLALVPHGATVLAPSTGGPPGLLVEAPTALIALLPAGAPPGPVLDQLWPRFEARARREEVTAVRTLKAIGLDPGEVEARLTARLGDRPDLAVRCYPHHGEVWVRLVARGATAAGAEATLARVEPVIAEILGEACYGRDEEPLEAVVGRLLRERGLTLAVAESCTGGLLGHRLTEVPGSSAYFERGLVVYSNEAKQALLGVPASLLAAHGAVSRPVAEVMARGVRERAGTDLGLAVTGIAGPEGGSPAKPVGTVFIAVAGADGVEARGFRFGGDRSENKALSALWALELLRRHLLRRPPTGGVSA
ncbi:MAG: nicotinamide-nucleotide amidohydrolase family protein [Candidatus Rokubacteria bacterium]|nr:nicotinamide-nucleotide amidohydrolase family protein [Candidatus Rokubacteria bacterium]